MFSEELGAYVETWGQEYLSSRLSTNGWEFSNWVRQDRWASGTSQVEGTGSKWGWD